MTVRSVPVDIQSRTPLAPDEEYVLVPPDGGWGWLVLGGTLLVNMLIPGTIKSFGVLFVEFLEVFDASPVAASWIPALCYFLYCSLGPFASYLSVKTSYKTVTILGGLFAASGMILSFFATSIEYLYFSYGVLVGTGAGLSFPPGIFIVTSYFVKYRGLANGLAISGSAIGSIILPPFLGYLLKVFGYRGAVLIMGGITLNVLVGALLYDPVEKHMKKVKVSKKMQNGDVEIQKIDEVDETLLESLPNNNQPNGKNSEAAIIIHTDNNDMEKEQPLLEQPRKYSSGTGFVPGINLTDSSRKVSSCSYTSRGGGLGSSNQISRKISAYNKPHNMGSNCQMSRNYSVASNMSSSSFRYVSTAFHGSTLVGLHPEFSSNPSIKETSKTFGCFSWIKKWRSKKLITSETKKEKEMSTSYSSLLKEPAFIIILLSNATNAIGYTNFTILVPAYAMSLGFDKTRASYLLSIVATLDLVGRIGGSALSDFLKFDKRFYYVGGLLISGISLAILPYFTTYNSVSALCAVFGLASGTYVGVTAVIMVDMLGEELLASSYGLSLFVNGVLQLVGPPICGAIFEAIQNYGPIFNGLGFSLIFGAALWVFLPLLSK